VYKGRFSARKGDVTIREPLVKFDVKLPTPTVTFADFIGLAEAITSDRPT
jgi:hypothetical protein